MIFQINQSIFLKGITNKKILPFIVFPFLIGCTQLSTASGPPASPSTSESTSDGQNQLNEATEISLNSAQNSLNQSRLAYANLTGRLSNSSSVDSEAFQAITSTLLTPMLITANALNNNISNQEAQLLITDFKQIYSDALTQMQQGINGNLRTYQNNIESPQALTANTPDGTSDEFKDQALISLAQLFEAMEITESFVTQLSQFNQVLPTADSQLALTTIQQQQTTVINGVINFTAQGASQEATIQAYHTIAKSLTSVNLISQLQQLAIKAFSAENVAFKQSEVTPIQPNPNQSELVIKEAENSYRKISVQNGTLVNQIINDTRGLSAADLLNATTAIKVTNQ